ncbi:DUF1801 domain-containing protein [Seonamhaeicola algicola]|uniref:DUF1801 domain-containing protein n=1 Tax=Seonamhaeicola algicola TaxID=1719036 RepID=A0A5C7AXL0_9FLAO|nr:DUF1801 domain-containing protein [Seonamhaeicola algicola]TXE12804.1 DUF1801 domain-containing protein [Seonamhaeicola algicola]
MQYNANTPEDYINQVPKERQAALKKLRQVINDNLPEGFKEGMQYKMIGYFVPHTIYPNGYHCNPKEPLPFMSFASQKHTINLYHSGIYAKKELYNWFVAEYAKHSKHKLDIGKSCIRFKYIDDIPFELIAALTKKITCKEWIEIYESAIKK